MSHIDVRGLAIDFIRDVAGNYFAPGHRIRIEIAGSSFPGFERNLQTGGRNYDEKVPVVAVNRIHPGSFFTFPVIDPK